MSRSTTDVAFTPSVKAIQERLGSRRGYAALETRGGWESEVTPELAAFLAERDSIYLGTASAQGTPYIQHRGGPRGFVKVIDRKTLAIADLSGNRQYISMGNLAENDRAFLFAMDYAQLRRIKIWGRAEFVEDDAALLAAVADPGYEGVPERALRFRIEAWDRNCPQHIPRLVPEREVLAREAALRERIDALETEVAALRAR